MIWRANGSPDARPKHPRAFLALPELPRNAQGKVVRARVREAVLATHALEDGPHPRLVARAPQSSSR